MSTRTYAGTAIELDSDGYLLNPDQWNEAIAQEIAADHGIEQLTDRHWKVISLMRDCYLQTRSAPLSLRMFEKHLGIPMKEMFELFPSDPPRVAARIAGLPKLNGFGKPAQAR